MPIGAIAEKLLAVTICFGGGMRDGVEMRLDDVALG